MDPEAPPTYDRLIYADDLLTGDPMSFADQPFLEHLFEHIRAEIPLTLFVGAGVSIEAGLPSWKALVDRLIAGIGDDQLEHFVSKTDVDIMRRAGLVAGLLKRTNDVDMTLEIRQALYPTARVFQPGQLALAVARLAVLRESEVRIITTNYDTILEQAVERYPEAIKNFTKVESFVLSEIDEWKKCNHERHPAVLHVHGLIGQRGESRGDVVLTESEFLASGAVVRDVITESLDDSMALLLGASITDPNLIGPVFETKDAARGDRYSLGVAGKVVSDDEDLKSAAKYHVETAKYLLNLDLKPILLKSYSQLNQVVSDLGLAIKKPELYSTGAKEEESLVYGPRFQRVLSDAYQFIGCKKAPFIPEGTVASDLVKRLRIGLQQPEAYLRGKAREYGISQAAGQEEEHFQLSLWLRQYVLPRKRPSYSLELMGSSAFEGCEPWATRRNVEIKYNSTYPAAVAVYHGTSMKSNLEPQNNAGIWKGVLAVPIFLAGTDASTKIGRGNLDQIPVGALAIDSTRFVMKTDRNNNEVPEKEQGIIALLTPGDADTLSRKLYAALPAILNLPPVA